MAIYQNIDAMFEGSSHIEIDKEEGGRGSFIKSCFRYLYHPPPLDDLQELKAIASRNEGFMVVRHPFVRLVSAYEVCVNFI